MSKTQKLHSENLTMFNNNYLLFDKRASNSLKKRLDLPLNFNRSKKINFQLTYLLVLLFEGKIKPTLKDAEERAKQPEPEPEPEPAAPIHPPLNPLTYEQYREYNIFYNNVLNNTEPEYFKDNKFFILEDTINNKGFIKGGYAILNKLLKGNTYLYNNIVLIVYGFKRQVIYYKDIIQYDEETGFFEQAGTEENYRKDHYLTDYTYNFIYNKHILNHQILQNSKDGYKATLYKIFSEITNSGEQYATMQLLLEPLTTQEQHQHQFKYGKINCFLNSIKSQLLEGGQRSKCEEMKKMYIDKIDILNDTYFNSGVGLTDIKKIEKNLSININVINAVGDYIYKNDSSNNKQIITLKSPYIDHIADYVKNEQSEINNKNKIVVDDIETHYKNNLSSFKYFKKNSEHKKVYYYDEHNIYYEAFKINNEVVNEDEIYIFDLLSYYKQKFINDNNLLNNVITNKDNLFYDFINNSVHHIDKYINIDLLKSMFGNQKILKINNSTDLNNLDIEQNEFFKSVNMQFYSIDNNKCYIGFLNQSTPAGAIYKKLGVPQSKFNFYKITEQPTPEYKNIILNGPNISFIEVDNICYINETIKNMNLIKNGYIYTSYFLKYCVDNNIIKSSFEWRTIATAQSMQYLKFCSEIIEQKFYNEIIGCMSSNMEHTILNFEVKNNADIKDILYYNSLNKDENNKILTYNKTVSIYTKKHLKQNRAHISSCILSYALINIIDVVKDVNINNLLYVKCDGISTLNPLNNIELTPNIGGWKIEDKKFISVNYNTSFINYKESLIYNENNIYPLTTHKQLYKSVNFITGAAGCSKTSRFLKKFDNTDDERIFNSLLLVPSNCLLYGLKKNNEALNIATYQSFIMAFYQMEDTHRENKKKFVKYTNIILDESTMINNNEMTKILKICKDNNYNIFIVGDYDIINKKSYQLKPPTEQEFFKCDDINDDLIKNSYQLHLTKNYRQNGDKHLYNLLNECRGKTNEYIKNLLLNHKMIKKIDYNDVIINYKNNEQILSSVNKFIDKINNDINDTKAENDDIKIMYCNTSKDTAKNESAIISKKDFNKKKHFLGYSITSHKAQGLTYTDNIYINLKNLFTDNILYVMISRAQHIEQIYIITE